MARNITVTFEDGTSHSYAQVPDTVTPEQVQQRAAAEFSGKKVTNIDGGRSAAPPPTVEQQLKLPTASIGKRMLNGVIDVGMGGVQLVQKIAEPVGLVSKPFGEAMDSGIAQQMATADAEGPEGIDFARLTGNALATAPTMALGGSMTTLPRMALGGARMGAAAGAVQPVDVSQGNYYGQKAGQVIGGAVAGGALTPAVGAFAGGISKAVNAVRQRMSPAMTPQQIEITLQTTLQQQGIDFAQLDAQTQAYLRQQVSGSLSRGGTLNAAETANAAVLRQAGIKRPTAGQISQNPTQFGTELFLRHQGAGAPLAGQYQESLQALAGRLRQLQQGASPALTTPEAGARVMQPLSEAAERGQGLVSALYDNATAQVGGGAAIDGALAANNALSRLERDVAVGALPREISGALNQLSTGQVPLTITRAQELIKGINRKIASATPEEEYALGVVRQELLNAIDGAGSQAGQQAADAFAVARSAASDRFTVMDSIPALKAASEGRIAPDDFLRLHVTGPSAKVEGLANLRDFLNQTDPAAWRQVQGQVLAQLEEVATKGADGKFLQSAFNKELRSLQQSGKLPILFDEAQIAALRNIGRAGELLEGPAGVMRNGLLGGARQAEALSRIISSLGTIVPGGGYLAVPAAEMVRNVPMRQAANTAAQGGGLTVDQILGLPSLGYLRSAPAAAGVAGTNQ